MISHLTTRCHDFIWFLIFTFTLYCVPHLELLFPYKFRFHPSEVEAAETQTTETQTTSTQGETLENPSQKEESPSNESLTSSSFMEATGDLFGFAISAPKSLTFTGAAITGIPIKVPPGRSGIAPNISFLYNSYQGSGWVGVGWNLDMGAIQRSTKKGVNYNANDYVAVMNGSHSELITRSDWGSNYYGAKIEGELSKYYFSPSGGWEVTTKQGMKYYYGTTSGSRQDNAYGVFKWCLDKVQDAKGNYMTVSYWKDQGEIYPDRIDWTGNGSLSPTNYIKFYLEPRTDIPLMYTSNSLVKTAHRLKSIEVYGNGLLQTKYLLDYVYSIGSTRSLLKSITQYGKDGSTLPAILFGWQRETTPHSWTITNNSVPSYICCPLNHFMSGEFDGDGNTDFALNAYSATTPVFFSRGDGTWDITETPLPWINDLYTGVITGDFNGDGKTDLALKNIYYATTPVFFSRGDGTWEITNNATSWINEQYTVVITGDFNGDGKTDLALKNQYYATTPVFFSRGDGTWDIANNATSLINHPYTNIITGDFNGDGKTDLVLKNPLYTTTPVFFSRGDGTWDTTNNTTPAWVNDVYTKVITGDFNGDGKTDLILINLGGFPQQEGAIFFSRGDGTWDIKNSPELINLSADFIAGDFNGDGKTDLTARYYNPDRTSVLFSRGDGTWDTTPITPSPEWLNEDYESVIGDFNGDGMTDISFIPNDYYIPDSIPIFFTSSPPPDLLTNISNGLGGTYTISYQPSSAYTNTLMPLILQTVSSVSANDGKGNIITTKYTYEGGLYDYSERELRGFKKVTAYQMLDAQYYESKTDTWFHQDYYLKGKIQTQTLTSKPPLGFTEGHTKQIVNNWLLADTLGGGKFPYLETSITTVTDQGEGGPFSYSQTTKDVYDIRPSDLANQTLNLLENHKNEGSTEEIVTLLEYTSNYTRWILSKITKVTVQNSSGTIASRKWMDYNDDGELITEELCKSETPNVGCIDRNSRQNVIISYQYDPTYKVLNRVTDSRGYLTTITYDLTKTFVHETTKCLDLGCTKTYTTTTEYDPGTGNILKLVSAHLQGTPYWLQTRYDGFGRKILERMKDNSDPDIPPIVDRGSTSYTYNDTGVASTQYVLKTGRIVIEGLPERTLTLNGYTYFDGMGRTYLSKTNGPDGKWIAAETLFDNIGRAWKQSNPYFIGDTPYYTVFTYDGLSRVTDTLKTDGYYIHTDYERLRKVVSKQVTATDWQSTAYYYDLNQKLVKVGEGFELPGLETFTEYTYDILGNLTHVRAAKDASGNNLLGASITTIMTYDSLMKKRSMTDPDMGYWTYTYDKAGNLETQTDAKGQTIRFEYNDGLNRLTQKTFVNKNPSEKVVYTYDDPTILNSKGKLTKVSHFVGSNPEVEVTADFALEYDLMQKVKKAKKKMDTNEVTFEKTFDSAGRVASIKYHAETPNEKTYSYEYDVAGDLLYVKDNASGNHLVDYSDFTALGQHKTATFPKPNNVSVKTTYTYDPPTARLRNLLTQKLVNGTPTENFQNLDYQQFDGVGNIKILADIQNNTTHNYTYDHLNRLTLANGVGTNAYTQSYQYDRIGNITFQSDVGTYIYDYANRPHAVKKVISSSPIYNDTQVNIIYNYDQKPERIQINFVDYIQFTYDGNGQRVKKYNYSTGQTTLYFGELYEQRAGVEILHLFAGSRRVASIRTTDGKNQFYHPDHLGSASVITDQNGDRKEQIAYFPFGTYRAVGNINGTYDFDPNFPDVFYTFTGQEDDDDLGLYNYGARLYDSVLGKFISPDSIVQAPDDPQTLNRYSYVRNNPLIYVDPTGEFLAEIILAISSLIVSIAPSAAGMTAYTIAATVTYATVGAAVGAVTSAIAGGNIGLGALTGAISGFIFYGAGSIATGISSALNATPGSLGQVAISVAVHTAAGSVSGAINSAITGSDIGIGMLTGAVGAGIGAVTGGMLTILKINNTGYQFVARTVTGGIAGGIASEIYGGNFWQGFGQGAATAAAAFLFNEMGHEVIQMPRRDWRWRFMYDVVYGVGIGKYDLTWVMCVYEVGYIEYWWTGQSWHPMNPPVQGYLKVEDLFSCPLYADPQNITIFRWVKDPPPGFK